MSIVYYRFDKYESRYSFHVERTLSNIGQSVLIFDPVLERHDLSPGDRIRKLDATIRNKDVVIFRLSSELGIDSIVNDPILREFSKSQKIFLLGGVSEEGKFEIAKLRSLDKAPIPTNEVTFSEIAQLEIECILNSANAIYHGESQHFVLPSGRHSSRFVRFADALIRPINVRRIADWVETISKGTSGILADSGTILPLLYEVCARNTVRLEKVVEVLRDYNESDTILLEQIRDLRERTGGSILAVISVNGSGKLVNRVQGYLGSSDKLLVLCDASESSAIDPNAKLSEVPIVQYEVATDTGKCELCDTAAAIHIDPISYEGIFKPEMVPVSVNFKRAEENRQFWELVNNVEDAIQYHVNIPVGLDKEGEYRHFGLYIDINKMLEDKLFRSIIHSKIAELQPVDAIIVPKNASSEKMIQFLFEYDICREIIVVDRIPFPEEAKDRLLGKQRIMVCDDAIVTGNRMREMRREIDRLVSKNAGPVPEVVGFVMIARPPNSDFLSDANRPYQSKQNRASLRSGFKVFLPRTGVDNCPWCRERNVLMATKSPLTEVSERARRDRIRELETYPLGYPLILRDDGDVFGKVIRGSVFGEALSAHTAFAASMSAAQLALIEIQGNAYGPKRGCVDINHALDAFFDSLLLAAILRSASPLEVQGTALERRIIDNIVNGGMEKSGDDNVAELLLAAIEGKLPGATVLDVVAKRRSESPVLVMLQEVLRHKLGVSE